MCSYIVDGRVCVCQCKQQTRIFLSFARQRAKKGEEKCAVACYTSIENGQRSLSRAEQSTGQATAVDWISLPYSSIVWRTECIDTRVQRKRDTRDGWENYIVTVACQIETEWGRRTGEENSLSPCIHVCFSDVKENSSQRLGRQQWVSSVSCKEWNGFETCSLTKRNETVQWFGYYLTENSDDDKLVWTRIHWH